MLFDLKHLHSDSHDTFVYDFISVVLSPYIMLFFIDLGYSLRKAKSKESSEEI